jgi:hypothetical protein
MGNEQVFLGDKTIIVSSSTANVIKEESEKRWLPRNGK